MSMCMGVCVYVCMSARYAFSFPRDTCKVLHKFQLTPHNDPVFPGTLTHTCIN